MLRHGEYLFGYEMVVFAGDLLGFVLGSKSGEGRSIGGWCGDL